MATLSLEPLHSNPELIDNTIALLKEEWPDCLAERLKDIETSRCSGLPCSFALTESREGAVKEVLGHIRVVQVYPKSENRVYLEAVSIKKTRRNEGLGRKLHDLMERHAKDNLNARYVNVTIVNRENERFYRRINYQDSQTRPNLIAANVLRTFSYASWPTNIIPDEWSHLYEGGKFIPKEEAEKHWCHFFVKDLRDI